MVTKTNHLLYKIALLALFAWAGTSQVSAQTVAPTATPPSVPAAATHEAPSPKALAQAKADSTVHAMPQTTVKFTETEHDFGKLQQGDKVTHVFSFKNTGTSPLLIANAKGSCGCTVPSYPKEPIAPGATGEINVVFNSKGKRGVQVKTVTLTMNTPDNPLKLTVKSNVEVPEGVPAVEPAATHIKPAAAPDKNAGELKKADK